MKPESATTPVPVSPHEPARARRSVILALVHAALALAILAGFVIAQVQRG